MVIYNPKDWWKLIFAFHKSDTFRMMLPGILGVALYTGIVVYIENEVFHATFKYTTAIHTLVGFVLSMLLVIRTNTAYERWWEGRKAWASFVNNSRNLGLKLSVIDLSIDERIVFSDLICNYIYAVKEHLRGKMVANELSFRSSFDHDHYKDCNHLPNLIMKDIRFRQFRYLRPHLIGSTAFHFADLVSKALAKYDLPVGLIIKKPIDRLVDLIEGQHFKQ